MVAMFIDPPDLTPLEAYKLAISLIVPRPIAWVGSISPDGIENLAPFSFFMGVSTSPPSIAISVARGRGGVLKDTAVNILANRQFSVSMVPFSLAEPMVQTGVSLPPDVSEFEAVGLESVGCDTVLAPRPSAASVTMECRLVHAHDMGSTHLLVGEVSRYHLADEVMVTDEKGHRVADVEALEAIGRLGGTTYCRVRDVFELRPQK
jgi:flavin reductase (DIM6/NTAB) family NADH-FMN oxidoreductase RutF